MPYIMGVEESFYPQVKNQLNENSESDNTVYIVNIKKNTIESFNQQKIKKMSRKTLYQNIREYPEYLFDFLTRELKEIKKLIEKMKEFQTINVEKMNKKIRSLFVRAFISLFGDYKKYVSILNSVPLLNVESFMLTKHKANKAFYSELISTHMFGHFIQDQEPFPYFEKMITRYNNKPLITKKSSNKQIRSNSLERVSKKVLTIGGAKSKTPRSELINDSSESSYRGEGNEVRCDSGETYIITPYFMAQNIFSKIDLTKIEDFISNKFKCNTI
jgi:hypothetical protein